MPLAKEKRDGLDLSDAIEGAFKRRRVSPMTNEAMGTKLLPSIPIQKSTEAMVRGNPLPEEMSDTELDAELERLEAEERERDKVREVEKQAKQRVRKNDQDRRKAETQRQDVHRHNLARAEAGFVDAMVAVSKDFMYGRGIVKNPVAALSFRQKAAHNGDIRSMYALSMRYSKAGSRKFLRAVEAAQGGDVSKELMGKCDALSFYWAMCAACAGSDRGMMRVACCFRTGGTVPKDESEADYWTERAHAAESEEDSEESEEEVDRTVQDG